MIQFVFAGLAPYIKSAAIKVGIDMLVNNNLATYVLQGEKSWHAKQIGNLLGQIPEMAFKEEARMIVKGSAQASLAEAVLIRNSLLALLNAADAAILEISEKTGIPLPSDMPSLSITTTEVKTDGTVELGGPDNRGVGRDVDAVQGRQPQRPLRPAGQHERRQG